MLRNRNLWHMFIVMLFLLVIGSMIAFMIGITTGVLVFLISLLLLVTAVGYTKSRYKDMERLSEYLRRIYGGDYTLDLRDNQEGELSILKNEIYKVTLILSQQAEQLKHEKRQLADAISDISHQLKTPLTSMTVMTELLRDETLTLAKRREFTKNLEVQLTRMEWLLSSLLKLARLDAGTIVLKKERVVVAELLKQSVKPLLIPMELKEQKLMMEGEDTVAFLGDADWTREAIINIIKNCVEHTDKGGTITIRFKENPIYTEIIIADDGCGVDREDIPFLFQRFYKGKNASPDSVGIGLAMAHSIIAGQNGDISVTSTKGAGTRFSIKLYKQIS